MFPNEPNIVINGITLNTGQSMTVRVALTSFLMELNEEYAELLGPVGPLYKTAASEVFDIMNKG